MSNSVDTLNEQPNFLVITSHDQGRFAGSYDRDVRTPNLDQLAEESVQLNEYYCPDPWCAPSRGAMQTGRLPHNNGLLGFPYRLETWKVEDGTLNLKSNQGWEFYEDQRTLPMYLQEAGYKSYLFGFQHVSTNAGRAGYDDGLSAVSAEYMNAQHLADVVTNQFFPRRAKESQPFYAEVATHNVHTPFADRKGHGDHDRPEYERPDPNDVTVPDFLPQDDRALREEFASYHEDLYALDKAVGDILERLEAEGLADNTVVVFTTDHGIPFPRAKGTVFDTGTETLGLFRFPDHFPQGVERDHLLSNVDFLPTILDIAGVPIPDGLDGRSFRPLLAEEGEYEPREEIFVENTFSGPSIRIRGIRTERYKYIWNVENRDTNPVLHRTGAYDTPAEEYIPITGKRPEEELYDLRNDPGERENLADDPEYGDVRNELRERLRNKLDEDEDPLVHGGLPEPSRSAFENSRP